MSARLRGVGLAKWVQEEGMGGGIRIIRRQSAIGERGGVMQRSLVRGI